MIKRIISLIALSMILLASFVVLGPIIFWFVLPIALPLYILIFVSARRERRPAATTPSVPRPRKSPPQRSLRLGGASWQDMRIHIRDVREFLMELLTWTRLLVIVVIGFGALSLIFFIPYGPFILSIGLFLGIGLIQFERRD